jgi:hypothetical protein
MEHIVFLTAAQAVGTNQAPGKVDCAAAADLVVRVASDTEVLEGVARMEIQVPTVKGA